MINKEIQDCIDYLLFLKYDRQLVWSNTTIAEMSDKHLVNAIKYLEQHNPNHKIIAAIPIVFAILCYILCVLSQYADYRKRQLPNEKYSEFCKRVYTRYL